MFCDIVAILQLRLAIANAFTGDKVQSGTALYCTLWTDYSDVTEVVNKCYVRA